MMATAMLPHNSSRIRAPGLLPAPGMPLGSHTMMPPTTAEMMMATAM